MAVAVSWIRYRNGRSTVKATGVGGFSLGAAPAVIVTAVAAAASLPFERDTAQALEQDPFRIVGVISGRTVRRRTPARGPFVGRD